MDTKFQNSRKVFLAGFLRDKVNGARGARIAHGRFGMGFGNPTLEQKIEHDILCETERFWKKCRYEFHKLNNK